MCTAITYLTKEFYFGRTLDFEFLYPCEVVLTPQNFPFDFRFADRDLSHYSILGMAYVKNDYPLYFDAFNEKGLCMAGLNFVGNAVYSDRKDAKVNIASFEFIPYILGKCKSVAEAESLLADINITDTPFEEGMPPSQLHWIIADKEKAITVESVKDGLKVYENKVGVLTNNPPFEWHLKNLDKYKNLTPLQKTMPAREGGFSHYSRGTGAIGLPGDYTSQSRFVRAAFVREYSHSGETEGESVNQFFHILDSVSVPEGCCAVESGDFDKTLYACCVSVSEKAYYYNSYQSRCIRKVCMTDELSKSDKLRIFPFVTSEHIININ